VESLKEMFEGIIFGAIVIVGLVIAFCVASLPFLVPIAIVLALAKYIFS
jgi:hypothetical protein